MTFGKYEELGAYHWAWADRSSALYAPAAEARYTIVAQRTAPGRDDVIVLNKIVGNTGLLEETAIVGLAEQAAIVLVARWPNQQNIGNCRRNDLHRSTRLARFDAARLDRSPRAQGLAVGQFNVIEGYDLTGFDPSPHAHIGGQTDRHMSKAVDDVDA